MPDRVLGNTRLAASRRWALVALTFMALGAFGQSQQQQVQEHMPLMLWTVGAIVGIATVIAASVRVTWAVYNALIEKSSSAAAAVMKKALDDHIRDEDKKLGEIHDSLIEIQTHLGLRRHPPEAERR